MNQPLTANAPANSASIVKFFDIGDLGFTELSVETCHRFFCRKQYADYCQLASLGNACGTMRASVDGQTLRHVVDVRHESFMTLEYLALARRYRVATVFTDAGKFPSFADLSGDFVYARLMQSDALMATGYADGAHDAWAERARRWAAGSAPADLPSLEAPVDGCAPRDVFVYFINGAKKRAPDAAMVLLARLEADSVARA